MSTTPPSFRVFPNGSSFMCWYERNCDRCKKRPEPGQDGENPLCDLESAIALASCLDGKLTLDGTKSPEEAAALAAGLCIQCAAPNPSPYQRCEPCRVKGREASSRHWNEVRKPQERAARRKRHAQTNRNHC
jgi:hypothetical protein